MATMKERALVIRQGNLLNLQNVFILLGVALLLTACGGGGGSASAPPSSSSQSQPASVSTPAVSNPAPSTTAADLQLAARLYQGDARTPDGFDVESRPSNVAGTLST